MHFTIVLSLLLIPFLHLFFFFFFNDPATTEIYTLSLHDALPISRRWFTAPVEMPKGLYFPGFSAADANPDMGDSAIVERSEEHTSELQSRQYLVCRLLLEKKKKTRRTLN